MRYIIILIAYLSFSSCLKEKRFENRLEGNTWAIKKLSIDGSDIVSQNTNPRVTLHFNDCDNKEENCTGIWMRGDNRADFYWKFDRNGKEFQLSNATQLETGTFLYANIKECYQCSGNYKVVSYDRKTNEFTFESSQTVGYSGKTVQLILKKI